MIVDVLANSERIEGLNPYFKVVFDYIKTHDLSSMPVGRIDIDGDNAYLKIEDAKGRKTEEAVYERHDKYIDIQTFEYAGKLWLESSKFIGRRTGTV